MVDLVKQDMTHLWAQIGDIVAPDDTKIDTGWAVETVPRQWWNWMQNRVDNNVAYALQKSIAEWDAGTEYIINKSYVQHLDVIYKCIQTGIGFDPAVSPLYWKKALVESTAAMEALKTVTPAADRLPYFTSATTATVTPLTAFARTILDDVDAVAVRATISAQAADATLTALAGVTTATNSLLYFTGVDTAAATTLSAFGRTLIDDADAVAARATLGLGTAATVNAVSTNTPSTVVLRDASGNFAAGVITAALTGEVTGNAATATALQTARTIGGVSFNGTANISLPGVDTAGNQNTSGNAATATVLATPRTINGVSFNGSANITVADATKLPLTGGTLTGSTTVATAGQVGYGTAALKVNSTGLAGDNAVISLGTAVDAAAIVHDDGVNGLRVETATPGQLGNLSVAVLNATTLTGDGSALTALNASNLTSGTLPDARLTGTYTGVSITGNAATATALQTARTINGVSFNGTANISIEDATKFPLVGGTITGATTIDVAAAGLIMKGQAAGVANQTYIDFRDSANVRDAYVGVASNTTRNMYVLAEAGNVLIYPVLGSSVLYNAGAQKLITSTTGVTVTGTCTATAFAGDGSALTALNAGDISAGTLAVLRGGTGVTTGTGTGSNVLSISPALTGVPTAPTAAVATDSTQIATTAFVKDVFNTVGAFTQSHAANGYVKMPNGTIIQWGTSLTIGDDATRVVPLPIAFPTACLVGVAVSSYFVAGTTFDSMSVTTYTTTTLTVGHMANHGTAVAARWIAIGY